MTPKKTFNIAIAGSNRMACLLAEKLIENTRQNPASPFRLVMIAGPGTAPELPGVAAYTDLEAIAGNRNIDVVIEAMGGTGQAYNLVTQALNQCRHVVTANVPLLSTHLSSLTKIALEKNVQLRFESAIMGPVPALHTATTCGPDIQKIIGILNGPSNFMLERMTTMGENFSTARQAAIDLKFASTDPTHDASGHDTLYKLTLLRQMAFGLTTDISQVVLEGIEDLTPSDMHLARKLGYHIRLVGTATPSHIQVRPQLIPQDDPLSHVTHARTGVVFETKSCGPMLLAGEGGGAEVAVAGLLTDTFAIPLNRKPMLPATHPAKPAPLTEQQERLFVRLPKEALHQLPTGGEVRVTDEVIVEETKTAAVMLEGPAKAITTPSPFLKLAETTLPVLSA